jgi:recombination protein RecA
VEFDILFGSGIDRMGCLLDAAEACGTVERKGSWYSRGDLRFAQGRRPTIEFLRSNQGLADEIAVEVREIMAKKLSAGGVAMMLGEFEEGDDAEAPME